MKGKARRRLSVNLTVKRGDTSSFSLAVTQSGAVYNLTGASIRFTAKWNYTDADGSAVFTRTIGSGITIVSAPNGTATITFSAANTSSLPAYPVSLYYDVQVTDGSSNIFTVVDGILNVNPDVSVTSP